MQNQNPPVSQPPKPRARPRKVSLWRYLRLFRQDILSAQPAHLYRAWMAEFRTPFFRSFLCNDPALVDLVLKERPQDFPKSDRIRTGLKPLLGNSVFNTNGAMWARQRRIIDPAFAGGRVRHMIPAMWTSGEAAVERLDRFAGAGPVDIEPLISHLAMDVIFRAMFSVPVHSDLAAAIFAAFQDHQKAQPVATLGALLPRIPGLGRWHTPKTRASAKTIRGLIKKLTDERSAAIANGTAPDDLATKIMTTPDPETGKAFEPDEMVDQVAIFLLAGHETSAAALSWALYLLARYPDWQDKVAAEAVLLPKGDPAMDILSGLTQTRAVFRETLRLYPPVPMFVREAQCPETFRRRAVKPGAQVILSPWHLHRHERKWDRPDDFDPARFDTENGRECLRDAFIPFSAGPRVCPGAAFAMAEGTLLLAMLVRAFQFEPVSGQEPVPVAHLTVRSGNGIFLNINRRQ